MVGPQIAMSVGISAPVTRSKSRTFLITRSAAVVPRPWMMRAASLLLSILIGQSHGSRPARIQRVRAGAQLWRDDNGTRLHVCSRSDRAHEPDALPVRLASARQRCGRFSPPDERHRRHPRPTAATALALGAGYEFVFRSGRYCRGCSLVSALARMPPMDRWLCLDFKTISERNFAPKMLWGGGDGMARSPPEATDGAPHATAE